MLERAQQRVLRADGTPLELSPRLFDALQLFVQRAGELLDKDFLIAALWPGLVVEENNLSQVIHALRRALGDDGASFIQTVPRRGFRFVAPVTAVAPAVGLPRGVAAPALAPAPAPRRRWLLASGLALGAAAGIAWVVGRSSVAARHAGGMTVAVLPFKPLAGAEDELLGVGMAESLIARLSFVPGLVVLSAGSVLRFRGPQSDPLRAARELEADWVVDGSLLRDAGRLRATARLLRVRDGTSVWSGSFDQKITDLFELQDQLAGRLALELEPALQQPSHASPESIAELGGTRNVEAYQLYLLAAQRAQSGRPEGIEQAVGLLHQALQIDPSYAVAWTQLAWSHRRRLWSTDDVPADVFRPANQALERALMLEPNLPQARAGLGFTRYYFDFDWAAAEREFRAALAANPSEVSAQYGLGLLLVTQDRIEEGLAHARRARELDPLSSTLNAMEGGYLVGLGRLEEARVRFARALAIAPLNYNGHVGQSMLHFAENRDAEGLASLRRAVDVGVGTTRPKALVAARLARLGRHDEARALLDELLATSRRRYLPPTSLATVQAALGDAAAALASLEMAVAVRDTRVIFLKDDEHWQPLRNEPRFRELLVRLKLDRFGRGLNIF